MGVEGHNEAAPVDKVPYPDIDRVFSYHPPEIEVPPLQGIRGGRFGEKECKLVAVPEKMLPHRPERFPDIAMVIVLQHRTDTTELIDDPLQGPEQEDDVFVFLEPVIKAPGFRKIPLPDKIVWACSHKPEKFFEECLERLYLPVGKLGGKKAGNLPVAVFPVSVNKYYGVVYVITGEVFFVPVVYGLEINGI